MSWKKWSLHFTANCVLITNKSLLYNFCFHGFSQQVVERSCKTFYLGGIDCETNFLSSVATNGLAASSTSEPWMHLIIDCSSLNETYSQGWFSHWISSEPLQPPFHFEWQRKSFLCKCWMLGLMSMNVKHVSEPFQGLTERKQARWRVFIGFPLHSNFLHPTVMLELMLRPYFAASPNVYGMNLLRLAKTTAFCIDNDSLRTVQVCSSVYHLQRMLLSIAMNMGWCVICVMTRSFTTALTLTGERAKRQWKNVVKGEKPITALQSAESVYCGQ